MTILKEVRIWQDVDGWHMSCWNGEDSKKTGLTDEEAATLINLMATFLRAQTYWYYDIRRD